jgi:hypothetical protein
MVLLCCILGMGQVGVVLDVSTGSHMRFWGRVVTRFVGVALSLVYAVLALVVVNITLRCMARAGLGSGAKTSRNNTAYGFVFVVPALRTDATLLRISAVRQSGSAKRVWRRCCWRLLVAGFCGFAGGSSLRSIAMYLASS